MMEPKLTGRRLEYPFQGPFTFRSHHYATVHSALQINVKHRVIVKHRDSDITPK